MCSSFPASLVIVKHHLQVLVAPQSNSGGVVANLGFWVNINDLAVTSVFEQESRKFIRNDVVVWSGG